MIVLGLTGSIGMGKSTTGRMFVEAGVPVHDADETVHRLYAGEAAGLVEAAFPGTVSGGAVDRAKLAAALAGYAAALKRLEAIIHPLVRADELAFLDHHRRAGAPLVVLDIPLLLEVGASDRVDKVAVVSAPAATQRERVLARPGMTKEKFRLIMERQIPDHIKRQKADFVIETGNGLEAARDDVHRVIRRLRANDLAPDARGDPEYRSRTE